MGREFTLPPSGLGFEQDQGSSPGLLGSWEERRSQAWRIAESYYRSGCRCLLVAGSRAWRAGCVAMLELAVQKVVVHPLVLLSVVDHFNR